MKENESIEELSKIVRKMELVTSELQKNNWPLSFFKVKHSNLRLASDPFSGLELVG